MRPKIVLPITCTMRADGLEWCEDANGVPVCGSNLRKKPGIKCRKPRALGGNRCEMHGAKSPRGTAHPNFKTGKHSKHHLPNRLIDDYAASMNNPDQLSSGAEIALLDARINDLLKRADSGESGHLWNRLYERYMEAEDAARLVRDAVASKDEINAARYRLVQAEALGEVGRLIKAGHSDRAIWNELLTAMESRRRIIETERKRMVDMQMFVTAQDYAAFIRYVLAVVNKRVSDGSERNSIIIDLNRIVETGRIS